MKLELSTRVDDVRSGRTLRPEVVRVDDSSWLGVHGGEGRAIRRDAVRDFLRMLAAGFVDVRLAGDHSRFEEAVECALSPSFRQLYVKRRAGPEMHEIAHVEFGWIDERPTLHLRAPAVELDFGHTTSVLRGTTWTLRRC